MATRRTVDLLPEIFRTETNKKFLSATLDQLTQEPNIKRTQGYVGRKFGPGVNPADNYVIEPTATRNNYQLEPGVVFLKPQTSTVEDAITYPGLIDALNLQGSITEKQDRLFESQYYSWDPFCDLDKFTNYSQYYWLAQGPDSVDISAQEIPTSDSWQVNRTETAYTFTNIPGRNPTITLIRGGNYSFDVNQVGFEFWIQAAPGVNGKMPATPNISSRDVLGVTNNGSQQGTVTFNVPLSTDQNFYYSLTSFGTVDLVTSLTFGQINGVTVEDFFAQYPTGIDGIADLDGRTIIFDTTSFDPANLYNVWQIRYDYTNPLVPVLQLNLIQTVSNLTKCQINFGTEYSSTEWYKNALGYFQKIPLLTAALDTLYYQDSNNPALYGRIKLVNQTDELFIDAEDIVGAKDYISPNGVTFTNGMKVQFRGLSNPPQFQDVEFYVEGVGTGPGITERVGFIDGQAYFGPFHIYNGQKMTGLVHSPTVYQQYIYDTIAESLLNKGAGGPEGAALSTVGIPGVTAGNGIKLIPVSSFVTPETYTKSESIPYDSTSYDSQPYDSALNAPQVPDYITINRASQDLNAWARSNRWFHIDVIRSSAEYNNQDIILDNSLRAKRPIIEFRADLRLYNFGTQGKEAVNIVDLRETDAFSNINGQTGYSIDGYNFIQGTRVIFAADQDVNVRNKIWEVTFIDPADTGTFVIDLVPAINGDALVNQTVVSLSGNTTQGKSYWFDGLFWIEGQQKIRVNQPPLFDVYNENGISFGNREFYPSTTFAGNKLFGYAVGTSQISDTYLGFPLSYLNIDNVGDIVFKNYLYDDTFLYVKDNISQTKPVSSGLVREYSDRVSFGSLLGWQTAITQNRSRQIFEFTYNQQPIILDIPVDTLNVLPPLQIYVEGLFLNPSTYSFSVVGQTTIITLNDSVPAGTIVEVAAISNFASQIGFYEVPLNLTNNPLNENSGTFTLGTIRTHYQSIGQNLKGIQGPIIGANNTRDLGDIIKYGTVIVQHSSPVTLTGVFLREKQFELLGAVEFNSREYQKYKALLLNLTENGDFQSMSASAVLDSVLQEISLGRSELSPFYWSDMLPAGEGYTETTTVYTNISTPVFDTSTTYNFTESNFKGLLVFLNGVLLTKGYQYIVSPDAPLLTITVNLVPGDVIVIREYPYTYGNYVPNTPTKMGLFPAYKPEIYVDTTYVNPRTVIRGHDGSITIAFNDIRDQVLLEFETRIFNNLKIVSPIPLTLADVQPGQFRTTEYTLAEVNQILSEDFLGWVGWNKLDYTNQTYLSGDPWTYNYSQSANKLTGEPSLGAWRGIYNYFYDTYYPDSRPWEMLGLSQKPDWWESEYGPAPYTNGNQVLWDDLAAGLIKDPMDPRVDLRYARPQLAEVIPVDSEGQLLNPLDTTIGNYDANSFRRSWAFGDNGPVENTWRTSSAWPFAVMRLLALTKPAEFFSLFVDRDRYVYSDSLEQYLWDGRYRLPSTVSTTVVGSGETQSTISGLSPLYGNGTSKASYLDWIIDFNRQLGINSTDNLTETLDNIDVRLCWRMAGFSGKNYLKVYTERATPDSTNTSLILPDESYQLLLYKNQPYSKLMYSSVIIQKVETGYAVLGYGSVDQYFEIAQSISTGNVITVQDGNNNINISLSHTDNIVRVPYGYVFTNKATVCDFLVSYGVLLENQGFIFDNQENGYILNWMQMVQEFLYWTQQGWDVGSIINLNPAATSISVEKPGSVVDALNLYTAENIILNQNRQPLPPGELSIDRLDNLFKVSSLSDNTINYLNLRLTAYEHLMVIDNRSIFADLIYQPVTGARQSRILISGWISGDWNGTVNAPGFVLNQNNVTEWIPNKKYAKGEIVLFKSEYWAASEIIQPSQAFDYSLWIKSEYGSIQKGLLPNAANSSDQLATAYSVYDANLEQEIDLFSYGLIGFRPREYMQALNLDDVSQVNLYQQFLKNKGTLRSAEIFSLANLGKETAEYKINEFWAILRSQYGATANRSFFELVLNQSLLNSNPSLIQVVQPGQQSQADQTVLVQNIWKSTTKITNPNILPTTIIEPTDVSLPTAGYVNLEDVDVTLFDFESATQNNAVALDQIGVNTTAWFAKVNNHDWGVYRAELVPGNITAISDNLNGRSLVQFSKPHGLTVNELIAIKYFDPAINGIYRVKTIVDLTSILIDYTFTGYQTTINGLGIALTLQTARVAQPSDVTTLPYALSLFPGEKVWVDSNQQGLWSVIEKTAPFKNHVDLSPTVRVANSLFGYSLSQGFRNLSALVGAPGFNAEEDPIAPGAVYTYVKTVNDVYEQNSVLQLRSTMTAGYGNAMDMGDQQWAVVGASASMLDYGYAAMIYRNPASDVFEQRQLLVRDPGTVANPTEEFGYSVTMSLDERFAIVGAPGGERAYVYAKIDVQNQFVTYRATDNQTIFSFDGSIIIDSGNQIVVAVNDEVLTYGIDYQVFGTNVVLSTGVAVDTKVVITRLTTLSTTGDGSTVNFDISSLYTATDTLSVSVYVNNALQRPYFDYNVVGDFVVFSIAPVNTDAIYIRADSYYQPIQTLVSPGTPNAKFGFSVSTTTNGRKIVVSAPSEPYTDPVTGHIYYDAGATYVYDRAVERFQVTDINVTEYTTVQTIYNPVAVSLNGVFLVNQEGNVNGTFSLNGNTVTIYAPIAVGDIIEIETNNFTLEQTLQSVNAFTANKYGYVIDQCVNDCSLYISSPYATVVVPEAGQVEFTINQSRVYGTTTSKIANPVLTPGDYIRVNNYFVELTGSTIADLIDDINQAAIPNALAISTPDLTLLGDSVSKVFDVGSIYSVADSYTTVVYVDDVLQVSGIDYSYDNTTKQITFVTAPVYGATILVVSGRITIYTKNPKSAQALNKLLVSPGTGTAFSDIGFDTYVHQQTIVAPIQFDFAHFGESMFISDNAITLLVSAVNGTPVTRVTFDGNTTTFDSNSIRFVDTIPNAGVVYSYDQLPSASPSVTNPSQFVFGQQIFDIDSTAGYQFGRGVDYTTGTLLVGSPGSSENNQVAYGIVDSFRNYDLTPAWITTRIQQPAVDIELLNTVFMYDRASGLPKQYFDYFNPSQGRLLGAVAQNLDFIGAIDPAAYNVGPFNNYGLHWGEERVGQIWWDISTARFIDTNQDDIVYASRRWGQLFPGSTVVIYQWVSSSVPPVEYTGPGVPKDLVSYTVSNSLNEQGIISIVYYFWVSGINVVNTTAGKTLSTTVIAQYIESPASSGITYIAPINASTIAIYNGDAYVNAQDTVLHIEYDQHLNDDAVHVEYQLIPQDRADGFLNASLYVKLQDSFCGVDSVGRPVPDPFLFPSEQFGVQARPRQSMFVNRFLALKNYLAATPAGNISVNDILAQYPITETRKFNLLNSSEPEPTASSGAWDKRVANYEELTFQNLLEVPVGYTYLVASDVNYRGLWTIYQVNEGALFGQKTLGLIRVQNYDTKLYWNYIDWYLPGYNKSSRLYATVPTYSSLLTITAPEGSSVFVKANNQSKWEIYQLTNGEWVRVALENGTIQISPNIWDYSFNAGRYGFDVEVFDAQFFDQEPVIETRKIIQAINEELMIGDLLIERNRLLILMFNYILSEQTAPNWLTKTSLIDVDHTIRELLPYQVYRRDNQDFVLNYIKEVKPYHVQIREFNLIYRGLDTYQGTVNDFDLPAYWDPAQNLFISPILDNVGNLSTTSSVPSTSSVWQTLPWNQWYQNYLLSIQSVSVVAGGQGYTTAPEVVVTGDCIVPAVMEAVVNSAGQLIRVNVIEPGSGYSTTAIITLVGGNGTGAQAVATMGNTLVRNLKTTIKYDRYEYSSDIVEWTANTIYAQGNLVRYLDTVWSANQSGSSASFDPADWTVVPADQLSGVNRTMGYYVPTVNEPGLDLALLMSGIDYPGVQVYGLNFNANGGFDVGNFDIYPFDNAVYGPEGRPTYDPAILDAVYQSAFTDPYLGIGPTAINVDGGQFVDVYSSHAPEELVPGIIFDTLDIRVFTTPGADWEGNGHGFPSATQQITIESGISTYSFAGLLTYYVVVKLWNETNKVRLIPDVDYTIDYVNETFTILSGASVSDIINITAYAIGGGNQLFTESYIGSAIGNNVLLPIPYGIVNSMVVFVNGRVINNYTFAQDGFNTSVSFDDTYTSTDLVTITALGTTSSAPVYSWSTPQTEYFVADGISSAFTLSNSLMYTNPANLVVEKNGIRARPAESVEYINDNSSLQYYCPDRGGYSPAIVADNEVSVYINNIPQTLGVDFVVDPWNGYSTSRTITLTSMPPVDATILISVSTAAQYFLSSNVLIWKSTGSQTLSPGDIVSVTSWNDTREQALLTQVFVGPTVIGTTITEGFDSTDFDQASITDTPGSFDYSVGAVIRNNNFDTGRIITDPNRLIVSVNGSYVFPGTGYVVSGSVVTITGPVINGSVVVAITSYTDSIVPGAIGFRIFQDMRGLQTAYRITANSTTSLVSALSATDDIIYVDNASKLGLPQLELGTFGVLTIDGERITYRNIDFENNTVSGLRRGTAGTAAADHSALATVYDMGIGNKLPQADQNYIDSQQFIGDNLTTTFVANDIASDDLTASELQVALRVLVGGIQQTSGYTVTNNAPITVEFSDPPAKNYQVSIVAVRAQNWYAPNTNGVPLQEQDTEAARFIRGL